VAVQTKCLSTDSLEQYLQGSLPNEEAESIEQHLFTCSACVEILSARASTIRFYEAASTIANYAGELQTADGELFKLQQRLLAMTTQPETLDSLSRDDNTPPPPQGEGSKFKCVPPTMPECTNLGNYELLEILGYGGMGVVYKARESKLGRPVAIKQLHRDLASDKTARERFLREARAAANIKSDHVVTIHGVFEHNDTPYLVMEFLTGTTLQARLLPCKNKVPSAPPQDIVRVGIDILEGLVAAHKTGVIHRDVKPSNIWIEPDGRAKLLDFGLGRHIDGHDQVTSTGTIVGTAAFMSPEQANGDAVDQRADLFSVGVVMYAMATGSSPFYKDELMATLSALANFNPQPLAARFPGFPVALSRFIAKLMSRDPNGRYENANEALTELRKIKVQPVTQSRRRWPMVAGLILVGLMFVAVSAIFWPDVIVIIRGKDGTPQIEVKAKDVKSLEVIDTTTNKKTTVKLTPDNPVPKEEEIRVGKPVIIIGRFADSDTVSAYKDSKANTAHQVVPTIMVGTKGIVLKVSMDHHTCCLRLESAPKEEVWVSLDNVKLK
jgi:serine/threonine protein kinase